MPDSEATQGLPLDPLLWSSRPGDLIEMEQMTGETIGDLLMGMSLGDVSWFTGHRLLAIAFLTMRRVDPSCTWAEARAVEIDLFTADDG